MEEENQLVKIDYIIEKTALSRSGAYKLVKGGAFPSLRFGHSLRFNKSDIDQYVKESIVPENKNKPVIETETFGVSNYGGFIIP